MSMVHFDGKQIHSSTFLIHLTTEIVVYIINTHSALTHSLWLPHPEFVNTDDILLHYLRTMFYIINFKEFTIHVFYKD